LITYSAPAKPHTHKRSMRHINQATCVVGEVLARDRASLALRRDLRVMLVDVIQALKGDPRPLGTFKVFKAGNARLPLP
jgi:hypothetical protein